MNNFLKKYNNNSVNKNVYKNSDFDLSKNNIKNSLFQVEHFLNNFKKIKKYLKLYNILK